MYVRFLQDAFINTEEDNTKEIVVVEEEKEQDKSRDFDLPPEMDDLHESVDEKPQQQKDQPPANFVAAFWQLFMTVFFLHFMEGNQKKLANEPANTTATTTTTASTNKKES